MQKVSKDFIGMLVNKYDPIKSSYKTYNEDELDNFYCENEDGTFTTCFNESGDCYCEDFKHLETVTEYLEGELDLDDCYYRDFLRDTNELPVKLSEEVE